MTWQHPTSGEKAGQGVPEDVVDPPLLLELPDAGVNEGIAGEAVLEGLEVGVSLRGVPGDVDADLVAPHLCIVGVVDAHREEELSPIQLDHDDGWGLQGPFSQDKAFKYCWPFKFDFLKDMGTF